MENEKKVDEVVSWTFNVDELSEDSFGIQIKSVTIRETGKKEELMAGAMKDALGKDGVYFEQLVKLSIVSINGKKVDQPYDKFDKLNTKTRTLLGQAFNKVNGTSDELVKSFLAKPMMTV